MVGVGEYQEYLNNPKSGIYRLNTRYTSIVEYYRDLISGKLLSVVPYDVVVSKYIISCKYINNSGDEIILIASVKNNRDDRASIQEKGNTKTRS